MKISDLHIHPSFKPFHNRDEENNTFQNIWNGVIGRNSYFFRLNKIIRDQIKETARDSQSNLNEFISGDMQTAAVAIHPVERGWFMRPEKKGRRFWKWLIRLFLNDENLSFLAASMTGISLKAAKAYITKAKNLEGVNFYEEETYPEYQYIASQENKTAIWNHSFELVKDCSSYQTAKAEGKIPLFLTIEGGHALLDVRDGKMFRKEYDQLEEAELADLENSLIKNIKRIKGEGDCSFNSRHTPIYITLAHMYQNFLTGHSRSHSQGGTFSPGIADLLDQNAGLNAGLTPLGKKAIDLLTSDANGSRILIDVKHLSVVARRQYYEIARERNIPIIGSHMAMAGVDTFPDDPKDTRKDHKNHYFSKWSINFSDEDIRAVHETDGILGLALHEGRMPGGEALKKFKKIKKLIQKGTSLEEHLRLEYMKLVMSNVFQIVKIIGEKSAWNRIMIGSDYDGIMNPFDVYPKTGLFQRFIYDLKMFLENPIELIVYDKSKETVLGRGEVISLMYDYSPVEIAEMIAIKNFESFIQRHFS